MKFKLLINTKVPRIMKTLGLNHQNQPFILLINVKRPTIVGILTLCADHDKFPAQLTFSNLEFEVESKLHGVLA